MTNDNPILNTPYLEPKLHYDTDSEGSLDYNIVCKGRRIFKRDVSVIPMRQKGQKELFEWNEDEQEYLARKEVGKWRLENYPNTTRITKELLNFWFNNPERVVTNKLFFAQREAVETAIWLNEVADKSNAGQHIINLIRSAQQTVSDDAEDQLPRLSNRLYGHISHPIEIKKKGLKIAVRIISQFGEESRKVMGV